MFGNSISKFYAPALVLAAVAAGCASIGTPGGGWYDETPPVFRSSDPRDGELNVKKKKFTLRFNENIKLDNVMDKMTISPPQEKAATVLSNAKTLTIELQDTLIPNTTYSISLGDAVQDNNEGNVLEQCSFSFSTGDHIDSLQIAGYLLNAQDLEPVTGAYVGIYPAEWTAPVVAAPDSSAADTATLAVSAPESADSIFVKRAMLRAGKTDAYGHFTIEGVAKGTYRLYALADGNTNYRYDLTTEDIAFLDTLVTPTMRGSLVHDTLWNEADTTLIDTVLTHGHVDYFPTDLMLLMFNEGKANRYLDDYARPDSNHLKLRFSARMDSLPRLRVVGPCADSLSAQPLVAETNPTRDTLTYWLRDSVLFGADTVRIEACYLYTDTTGADVPRIDTLTFLKPVVRTAAAKDEKKEKKGRRRKRDAEADTTLAAVPQVTYMTMSQVGQNTLHIGEKPRFEVSAPLDSLHTERLHLARQVNDSTWEEMAFRWEADTLHVRRYWLLAQPHFSPGQTYRLSVDSAAMHDIYGQPINAAKFDFKERTVEEYAHLLFNVLGVDGDAFMQLLNGKDQPVLTVPVADGKAKFVNVPPGKYFARLVVDRNGNGIYDAGLLFPRRQPETVYYFDAPLELRANWSVSQQWDVQAQPLVRQKPDEVKINKPKEKQEKKSKNAEYYEKMGITPPQTNTGTTTNAANPRLHTVGN